MDEKQMQRDYVMRFFCLKEEEGGLGYRNTSANQVSPDLFIPSDMEDFLKTDEDLWNRLVSYYNGNKEAMLADLRKVIKAKILASKNVATFLNSNKTIGFANETVPLFYVSGSVLNGDEDFKKNIFSAVEESSHTFRFGDKKIYAFRPDVSFFLNGIFIGYMELKTIQKGQTAKENGRRKVAKDYLATIKGMADRVKAGPVVISKEDVAEVLAVYEKAIHLTTSDIDKTFVLRGISNFYKNAYQDFLQEVPHSVDELVQPIIDVFKEYPTTSPMLSEQERFEEVMRALYSKRMIEKEILYFNFIEYKYVKKNGRRVRTSNTGHLIAPRPKQKFGCDKIMNRIQEMLDNEKNPDYYTNKLRDNLAAIGTPAPKIEEIVQKRERYCNNKYIYSLLMQYAAGFGKSNIIGWLALQLKDYRYDGDYAYNKILLVVDRLQLRDQLDTMMMNMNIDKSMFIEATDNDTFVQALDEQQRIIVVNIQKFLEMQKAINNSERKLKKMRVAFLIDEIHRSNSGEENEEMLNIFDKLQDTFNVDGRDFAKKNLLVGFTATPSDESLTRFGEYNIAGTDPMWIPFDCYTMKEAIADGYILDPTKHIITYAVPVEFVLPDDLRGEDDIKIRESKPRVYAYEPRMRKIAEFIVERLVSLVYGKMCGQGKAMLAVSSIPNAIKYFHIIKQLYAEKCKEKKYERYKDAPICIVYSNRQEYESCSSLNGGVNEETVISNFKNDKNGLIIVVDKLQTGFDEPKLHTLFLDKEITDINAIQTISRVNRTCPNKEECHIVDCSFQGINRRNIKQAFKKFCGMVISDFNPENEAQEVVAMYRQLTNSELYKTWYSKYLQNRGETMFMLELENAFTQWITKWIETSEAARAYNEANELKPGDDGYRDETNAAMVLRWQIGQFGSATMDLKGVFEIDEKYYDELFNSFWELYCHIYRKVTRSDEKYYEYEVVDSNELPGITMVDDEDDDNGGRTGGGARGPVSSTPKGKSIEEVLAILKALNDKEQIKASLARIWLKEIGDMFQEFQKDEELMAYLKDRNYSEEEKFNAYKIKQDKYRRGLRRRPDFPQVDLFKKMLDESAEQLFAIFMKDFKNVENGDSDFDYDTTENTTSENAEAHFDIEQIRRELMQKIRPTYHEGKLKEVLVSNYASEFEVLGDRIRSMEEVVDNLFMVLNTKSGKEDLDGVDEILKDSLNMVCRAEGLKAIDKRQYLNSLLIKYESFLKKLYYLMYKKDVPFPPEDRSATLKHAVRAIDSLKSLRNTTNPVYKKFDDYLNILRDLRNTESHGSINISEMEIDAALRVVIDMYLFVIATNITNLEMAGYYPDVAEVICMNKVYKMDDDHMNMAAEPRG